MTKIYENRIVQIIISEEQYDILKQKAAEFGLKPATYGRLLIITILKQNVMFTSNMTKALESLEIENLSNKSKKIIHMNLMIPENILDLLDSRILKLGLKSRADYLRLLLFNSTIQIKIK